MTENSLGISNSFEISDTEALDFLEGKATATTEDIEELDEEEKAKAKKTPKATPVVKKEEKASAFTLDSFEEKTEEEEEQKEEKEEEEEKEKTEETEEESSPFNSISKELIDLGIFTLDEDEELDIQDADTFAERWQYEKKKGVVSMLDDILTAKGEDKKEWFDAIVLNGVDPKEYMKQQVVIDSLANLDLTKESNQEKVVRAGLKEQGFEGDDIEAKLKKVKDYGDLEEEATRMHKVLLKKETQHAENMRLSKEQEVQRKAAEDVAYKTALTQIIQQKLKDKEYDGIPLTAKEANDAFDFLYTKKYKLPNGELLTEFDKEIIDLKNHPDLKLKMGLIMQLLKKDPTLSTITKKQVSKQSGSLFSELTTKKKEIVKAKAITKKPESWFK